MPKLVCCACDRAMVPAKNGVAVVEAMPLMDHSIAAYEPYKLWMADRWRCLKCSHEIITGFAAEPISEHYREDFKDKLRAHRPERSFT